MDKALLQESVKDYYNTISGKNYKNQDTSKKDLEKSKMLSQRKKQAGIGVGVTQAGVGGKLIGGSISQSIKNKAKQEKIKQMQTTANVAAGATAFAQLIQLIQTLTKRKKVLQSEGKSTEVIDKKIKNVKEKLKKEKTKNKK